MKDLVFEFDWEDPKSARGEELRATWGRLQIKVGDEIVTRLIDENNRCFRDAIYGPLYPIAEWIAMNWWSLFFEIETPQLKRSKSYSRRHCLCSASEGFALPQLTLIPSGTVAAARWGGLNFPKTGVTFIETGEAIASIETLRQSVSDFINAVVGRLDSSGVKDTPLQLDWEAISSVESEEREFCEVAGALGLDPFALDEDSQALLIEEVSEIPNNLRKELLAVADFEGLRSLISSLKEILHYAEESSTSFPALRELGNAFDWRQEFVGVAPWEEGYVVARKLRELLGLEAKLISDDGSLAKLLSVPPNTFSSGAMQHPGMPRVFDAIIAASPGGDPVIITGRIAENRGDNRRFTLCRAVFESLSLGHRSEAIVSRAHSDEQRRNRAFAAEFLAPERLLRNRITSEVVDEEQVDDLAEEFGVSTRVIRHQIENHHIAALAL